MKKATTILFLLCGLITLETRAQLIPYAGISAGYLSSSVQFDPEIPVADIDPRSSVTAGLHLEWLDNPIVGMLTDFNYFSAGARIDDFDSRLELLSLAQQVNLYVPMVSKVWDIYLAGGPQLNYLLDHNHSQQAGSFNEWTWGYRLGIGVEYSFRDSKVFLRGQYASDISPQYEGRWTAGGQGTELKNSMYFITTGIALEL